MPTRQEFLETVKRLPKARSRTLRFGMLLTLAGPALEVVLQTLPQMEPLMGKWTPVAISVVGILVSYYRIITTGPIRYIDEPDEHEGTGV